MMADGLRLGFDNSYRRLPERFYACLPPTPVAAPHLLVLNADLAETLGLDLAQLAPVAAELFAGNRLPADAEPIATAYAGHQFGQFVPQLGDGRAILLGELIGRDGQRRDVQLKGAGRTPFSRHGDGRAALGPVLREFLISEAMHALRIPTTRALAAVLTGEPVFREEVLPGAVLTRVAASHIRVGTFQYFAVRGDLDAVRRLADHAIALHDPELAGLPERYLAFLAAVAERQAYLVARWMQVGFVHGVMNTDNMAVSGETIDYGPCAFIDAYDPASVFSSIDQFGRYAFANQPLIARWNLARLAETLLPLIDADSDRAIARASEVIDAFPEAFERHWLAGMRAKLGLTRAAPEDRVLIDELLAVMQATAADYTRTFRGLAEHVGGGAAPAGLPAGWLERWRQRRAGEPTSADQQAAIMRAASPAFIPRNHRVEEALAAARAGDLGPFEVLRRVLGRPYDDQPEYAAYMEPPPPSDQPYRTFCGT